MGKVLKQLAIAAVVVGLSFVGLPPQVSAALFAAGTGMALATVSQALFGPKMPKAQASRLNATFEPQAHRKFVIGSTAMNTDIRYYETSGTDQEYFDYIVATSAHEVESIDEIWFDDEIAWNSSTGIASKYSGYLTINTRAVGTSANTISINGGGIWGSSCRLTGCSYVHLRLKRTGNSKKAESPLVNGLPNRLTIKGKGAKIYDPRLDSTVTGGSGSHRANDQTTWGTANSTNRDNPALQLLWFLLGWKINGKLSVGCGVPYERIDLASFITAANICDEAITLAAGGTQPRYRTAGVGSDADNRMDIIQLFLTCMNGTLRDSNGRLSVQVMKNDLATPVLSFDDDDVLEGFTWNQTNGLDKTINAVHGKYSDSSNNSLYQSIEYPTVSISSVDNIERLQTLDLPWVEDGKRAQRIAKQVLQRAQYKGVFSTTFSMKALGCEVGDVVYITFGPLGWANKPFRVLTQIINNTGRVPMTLIEENAAIYAWDAEEQAVVTPTAPTVYDPLNSPYILAISDAEALADGKITSFYQSSAPTAEGVGDIWIDTDDANKLYRWSGSAWILSRDTGITTAISAAATAQSTADGKVVTFYQSSAPTAQAIGDLWIDNDDGDKLYRWSGSAWVLARDADKAFNFTQDSPTPSATYIGQTWYKPTSKEWYYSTGTGTGNWQRILGDMSLLNENTRVAIVSGFKYFNSNDYSDNGSSIISIVTDYTFTPYWADSKIQITVFGYITDVDSDDSTSTMYGRIYINGSAVGAEQTVAYGNSGQIRNYSFNVPQTSYSGSTLVQARFKRTGTATSFPGCQAAIMIEEFLQ